MTVVLVEEEEEEEEEVVVVTVVLVEEEEEEEEEDVVVLTVEKKFDADMESFKMVAIEHFSGCKGLHPYTAEECSRDKFLVRLRG